MSHSSVPTRTDVQPEAREIFDGIEEKLGFLPNLYAYIGHSPNALASYLEFQNAQAGGAFNAREREAVFLAVSEANGCDYCRAAHTALGKMNGFSDEETIQLRSGDHVDPRISALVKLASEITTRRGRVDEDVVDGFFAQGFGQDALVDLVALVAAKTMSNYLHNLAGFEVDFPAAEPIEAPAAV